MAIISFGGVQAIASSSASQPVFGSTLSAAVAITPDKFSNNNGPGSNQTQAIVPVATGTGKFFSVGQQVAVGPAAAFKPSSVTAAAAADVGIIKAISTDNITVQGLQKNHASGEFFVVNEVVANVHICPVGGGSANDALYIGNSQTVSSTDPSVFDIIAIPAHPGLPTYVHDSAAVGGSQPYNTSEYWIAGTSTDTFVARYTQV